MTKIGLAMIAKRPASALRAFLDSEAAGGLILIAVSALALFLANSIWADTYFHFLHAVTGPILSPNIGAMTVHLWINDALMAVFFLLVGLEIKREFVDGHLASWSDRRLPVMAAAAGMIVPALVYLGFVQNHPALLRGWAIPAATDIAFAIGILALLGKKAPASLKLFLTTVAIVDDMGAIAIIALFYSGQLNAAALLAAGLIWLLMLFLNRRGFMKLSPYLLLALLLWYAMLLSGVHATIAGVLAAVAIPYRRTLATPDAPDSPLHRLEHMLSRPVAFLIIPLFGFANAGLSLSGIGVEQIFMPLPLAIALGLFIGKQIGIFASIWLSVKLGWAKRPKDANWLQVYGVALLCGIGFTMSLFIGGLAFDDSKLQDLVKLGVLIGSVASAVAGFVILRLATAFDRSGPANR
jgi:Na+:H+ antiporter, NhaA family